LSVRTARAFQSHAAGRFVLDVRRVAFALARGFRGERIGLRASALTYITIFSLVPLLTVAIALVETVGAPAFRGGLREFMLEILAPGIREDSARVLGRFLDTAGSAAAGTVGFVFLLFSAGSLLRHLDHSLNEIWNIRKKRSLPLRLGTYLGVLLFAPLLLAAGIAGMGVLREHIAAQTSVPPQLLAASGTVVAVIAFTLLYRVVPNAHVRMRSALAGGLVAGVGWDFGRHLYGEIATRAFRASPLWGSLGAVPLFLTWIYVGWLVLLFGARLSYAVQFAWFARGMPSLVPYPRADALLAALIAGDLARRHELRARWPTVHTLADELLVTVESIEPVLDQMAQAGLIRVLPEGRVAPARSLDALTLADTARAVGGTDPFGVAGVSAPTGGIQSVLEGAEREFLVRLGEVRWSDLPQLDGGLSEGSPGSRAPAPPGGAKKA
jgi:membrane protein